VTSAHERAMPDPGAPRRHDAARQPAADARSSAIAAGRRKGGAAGAAMAGAMLAMRDLLEGPPKEELPFEIEASGQPHDLDRDGVDVTVGETAVSAPPLARRDPLPAPRARRRR
jgi:hypothetical protein